MEGVDFGRTSGDYGRHRAGFPPALLARLAPLGVGLPGQRVLDLGTGTGALARLFAAAGCTVVGLDPALPMLRQAQAMDAAPGATGIAWLRARAEETPLRGGVFDGVAAGQCWHWFTRPRAAAEVWRLLRPGGWALITHFDWVALRGNVVEATEALILRHNPAWRMGGGTGVYPKWYRDLGDAGFTGLESFTFDVDVEYTHAAWRGRIRASAGVAASLSPAQVAAFDAEHAALLRGEFPTDPLLVPHRVFALVAVRPPAE